MCGFPLPKADAARQGDGTSSKSNGHDDSDYDLPTEVSQAHALAPGLVRNSGPRNRAAFISEAHADLSRIVRPINN
jgi:hypothetical protein